MTMAIDSSCQKELQIKEFPEGNLKLNKSSDDGDLNRQFSLDIPPIRVEETSLPAGLHGLHLSKRRTKGQHKLKSNAQDVYSISMVSEEGANANCASSLAFLSVVEVPNQATSALCLDSHMSCQNCVDFQKSEDTYAQCIVDIPSVNGNSVSSESFEEGVESFKTGNSPTSVLYRESSLKAGAKPLQNLVNLSNPRDKPVTEKVLHDLPSNKWRRYKRSASFDSRKVALLFSILSSLGTLVLIYLTLRVRQRADGFVLM